MIDCNILLPLEVSKAVLSTRLIALIGQISIQLKGPDERFFLAISITFSFIIIQG